LSESKALHVVRDSWLRRGLAAAWILLFAMCGFAVASSWDRLVEGLMKAPVPARREAHPPLAGTSTPGEHAVAEARRLLDGGLAEEALGALQGIKPEEPVYPFSLQLREEARRALARQVPAVR